MMVANETCDSRSKTTRWLILILSAAFLLRAAVGLGVQCYLDGQPDRRFLIEGDANGYWELGRRIAAGEDYAVHIPPRYVMRTPGFPLLLALSGGSFWLTRLLLAAVGTLACGLVFLLGRDLAGERIGLIATATCAMSPPLLGFSVLILSETTFAATMLGGLIAGVRTLKADADSAAIRRTLWLAFATGVLIAAACCVRPGWIFAGPVFAGLLIASSPRRLRACGLSAVMFAGMAVALAPWVVRNYRVTGGHVVVTTLWAGPSLYDGLNPEATGDSDMSFFERDLFLEEMSEYDMDRRYREMAWQFAREHPGRAIELALAKQARYWKPWPNAAQFRRWWLIAGCTLWFAMFYLPVVLGALHSRKRLRLLVITLGPLLYFAVVHAIFVGSIRYRLPAEYPLSILAAIGIAALIDQKRIGRKAPPAAPTS